MWSAFSACATALKIDFSGNSTDRHAKAKSFWRQGRKPAHAGDLFGGNISTTFI